MADGDKNKDVIFRRIRGRIVPIRVKRSRSFPSDSIRKRATGVGLSAASFGAAAIGGAVQKRFQSKARAFARKSSRASGLLDIAKPSRVKQLKKLQAAAKGRSKALLKSARRTRFATIGIAGTILGAGIEQIIGSKDIESRAAVSFATNIAGTALAGAFLIGRRRVTVGKIKKAFGFKPRVDPQLDLFKPIEF